MTRQHAAFVLGVISWLIICIAANEPVVNCQTTKGSFSIHVKEEWAPLGAARFLELVDVGFFTDVYFFRVATNFLTQFGAVEKTRKQYYPMMDAPIKDDPHLEGTFKRGWVSFAGGGPNTRTSQLFICFHDSSHLGKADHEVPFGYVSEDDLQNVVEQLYDGYGDIYPFNKKGPDQTKIFSKGNDYIHTEFPMLDALQSCTLAPNKEAPLVETDKPPNPVRRSEDTGQLQSHPEPKILHIRTSPEASLATTVFIISFLIVMYASCLRFCTENILKVRPKFQNSGATSQRTYRP